MHRIELIFAALVVVGSAAFAQGVTPVPPVPPAAAGAAQAAA